MHLMVGEGGVIAGERETIFWWIQYFFFVYPVDGATNDGYQTKPLSFIFSLCSHTIFNLPIYIRYFTSHSS